MSIWDSLNSFLITDSQVAAILAQMRRRNLWRMLLYPWEAAHQWLRLCEKFSPVAKTSPEQAAAKHIPVITSSALRMSVCMRVFFRQDVNMLCFVVPFLFSLKAHVSTVSSSHTTCIWVTNFTTADKSPNRLSTLPGLELQDLTDLISECYIMMP